jgi:hypothetical protein
MSAALGMEFRRGWAPERSWEGVERREDECEQKGGMVFVWQFGWLWSPLGCLVWFLGFIIAERGFMTGRLYSNHFVICYRYSTPRVE